MSVFTRLCDRRHSITSCRMCQPSFCSTRHGEVTDPAHDAAASTGSLASVTTSTETVKKRGNIKAKPTQPNTSDTPEKMHALLGGARSLCDVLEEYGARLRGGVARARADGAGLLAASRAAAARARRLRAAAERALHAHRLRAAAARDRARAAEERRAAIEAAAAEEAARHERRAGQLAAQRDRAVAELQARAADLRAEAAAAAAAARERDDARALLRRLQEQLTESEACVGRLNQTVSTLTETTERLTGELGQREQEVQHRDGQIQEMCTKLSALEVEKASLADAAAAAEEARAAALDERARLAAQLHDLQRRRDQLADEYAHHRAESERGAADGRAQLAAADDTIARLMRDVQAEADARYRLDLAAKGKDEEIARHLALLADIKGENDRLRASIAGMQATIDNVQKELAGGGSGRRARPERLDRPDRPDRPERLRADPPPDRMLYNFLSDASNDAEAHDSPLSLSQVKRDLNAKSRAFFKNKRPASDPRNNKHK